MCDEERSTGRRAVLARGVRWGWLMAGPLVSALWLIGVLVRDRFPTSPVTLAYYLPTVAVAVFCLAWLIARRRQCHPGLTAWVGGIGLVALLKVVTADMAWNEPSARVDTGLLVIHWNVSRPPLGAEGIRQVINEQDPDICLLSEARALGRASREDPALWGDAQVIARHGMILISRYPVSFIKRVPCTDAEIWTAAVATPDGELEVVAVDVASHPLLNRALPVVAIMQYLETRKVDRPYVILGDFNTLRDSVHFIPLRERVLHAYEEKGSGWPYTWPMPCPLYAIDHAWVSAGLLIRDYRLVASWRSDHRLQALRVEFAPTGLQLSGQPAP